MTVTALGIAPLRGKAVIINNSAPTLGDCNVYNTLTAGTSLVMTLPQLGAGVQTVGGIMLLEKDPNDTSANSLTFNCYAGDTFVDGNTSLIIPDGGMLFTLEVVSIAGVLKWKIIGGKASGLSKAGIRTTVRKIVTTVSAPSTSQTINTDATDVAKFTSVATALNLSVSGTPYDHQPLSVFVTDNGTSQPIAFNASQFGVLGVIGGLPAWTPTGRRMRLDFFYDAGFTRWILSAIDTVGYAY